MSAIPTLMQSVIPIANRKSQIANGIINPSLGYLSLYKNESTGQHIKSPAAESAEGKW